MRKLAVVALILTLTSLFVGCGGHGPTLPSPSAGEEGPQPPGPQPQQPGDLVVKVELDTGEPVANAQVALWPAQANPDTDDPLAVAATNQQGMVTFTDLQPGDYIVLITYGETTEQRRPKVPSGDQAQVTVIVPTEQPEETGSLKVCCTLTRNGDTGPLEGAEIQVFVENEAEAHPNAVAPMITGTTGADGCVTFDDLTVGSYLVIAFYESEQQTYQQEKHARVNANETTEVNFNFTEEVTTETGNLLVTVKRPVELARPREEPVEGATVQVYRQEASPESANAAPVAEGITDENGQVLFRDLPVDSYRVVATDPNVGDSEDENIDLQPGDNELLILLPPRIGALHVCVKYYDSEGTPQPAEGTIVAAYPVSPTGVKSAAAGVEFNGITGRDGCVYIDSLPPGTYYLTAEHPTLMMHAYLSDVTVEAGKITEVTMYLEEEEYY